MFFFWHDKILYIKIAELTYRQPPTKPSYRERGKANPEFGANDVEFAPPPPPPPRTAKQAIGMHTVLSSPKLGPCLRYSLSLRLAYREEQSRKMIVKTTVNKKQSKLGRRG